jgi:hypothetical protein
VTVILANLNYDTIPKIKVKWFVLLPLIHEVLGLMKWLMVDEMKRNTQPEGGNLGSFSWIYPNTLRKIMGQYLQ